MILARCKDKSDLDKINFIIIWEKEIPRPTDQTCFFVKKKKKTACYRAEILRDIKYLSKTSLIEEVICQQNIKQIREPNYPGIHVIKIVLPCSKETSQF